MNWQAGVGKLLWTIEEGIIKFLNNIFVSDENKIQKESTDDGAVKLTNLYLTPENIIKGRFILFDANIFKEITSETAKKQYYDLEVDERTREPIGTISEGRKELREIIASWYYALRNFAIVALLSVLVYVGIRMIISTMAQDKAKYKLMFKDWLIALCLVVLMHYMMIGILNLSTMIMDAMGGGQNANLADNIVRDITGVLSNDDWTYTNPEGEILTLSDAFAKILVFAGIIGYTFIFAVKYLKREFTVIFLILLGPVSCITYPIDKISDGKAQAFNRWFTEFIYQVIIQPFHLLLYIVLVGSAAELAEANVLYALVCFAILIPSEKFVKEMFGFKDRLGSPLGAFAGGALAAKALSALTGGGKGGNSGGNKGGGNDDETKGLPPKTVEEPPVGEEEGHQDGQIERHDNPEIEREEGNQEGQVDQNNNPEIEGEQEGQIDQGDNPGAEGDGGEGTDGGSIPAAAAGAALGLAARGARAVGRTAKAVGSKAGKALAEHNIRAAKKWGSTSRRGRWARRVGKGATKIAKFGVRAAGVGAGALVGGAVGAMFGKGAAGAGAGMVLGSKVSGRVISGASGVVKTGAAYVGAIRGDKAQETAALRRFKADASQIEKARLSYKDRVGVEPGSKALDEEITDRFELSRYGLDDQQIDKAIGTYKELIEDGYSVDNAAMATAYTSQLSKDYSPKDFRSEKTMAEALKTISQRFQARGVSAQVADANARRYLTNAAAMRKTEIALPSTSQTVDVQLPPREIASSLGVEQSSLNNAQVERMNNITVRLHQAGFSGNQIRQIATSCKGGNVAEVLDKYEVQVEYLNDRSAQDEARMTIEARNGGSNATQEQVNEEMRERLILKSTFDVKTEKDVTALRDLEQSELRGKSQIQYAREFANKHRGQLNNEGHMASAKRDLINILMQGGSSSSKATKDANNIINMAAEYNNEIITWDNQ